MRGAARGDAGFPEARTIAVATRKAVGGAEAGAQRRLTQTAAARASRGAGVTAFPTVHRVRLQVAAATGDGRAVGLECDGVLERPWTATAATAIGWVRDGERNYGRRVAGSRELDLVASVRKTRRRRSAHEPAAVSRAAQAHTRRVRREAPDDAAVRRVHEECHCAGRTSVGGTRSAAAGPRRAGPASGADDPTLTAGAGVTRASVRSTRPARPSRVRPSGARATRARLRTGSQRPAARSRTPSTVTRLGRERARVPASDDRSHHDRYDGTPGTHPPSRQARTVPAGRRRGSREISARSEAARLSDCASLGQATDRRDSATEQPARGTCRSFGREPDDRPLDYVVPEFIEEFRLVIGGHRNSSRPLSIAPRFVRREVRAGH